MVLDLYGNSSKKFSWQILWCSFHAAFAGVALISANMSEPQILG